MAKKKLSRQHITLSEEQKDAKRTILDSRITFLEGDAGTSKTFLSVEVALDLYSRQIVDKIIITRPPVEAGPGMGFLPGDLGPKEGKLAPYLIPVFETIEKILGEGGKQQLDQMLVNDEVVVSPPQLLRGRNFERAVIIVDEGQNLTVQQLKLILSRLCKGSKLIFTMDKNQIDLTEPTHSCYFQLHKIKNVGEVSFIKLTENHRDPLALELIKLIER